MEGVLQIANCSEEQPFSNEDHFVLQVVAEKIAEFVEGQRSVAMLKGSLSQQVRCAEASFEEASSASAALREVNEMVRACVGCESMGTLTREVARFLKRTFQCRGAQLLIREKGKIFSFNKKGGKVLRAGLTEPRSVAGVTL